MTKVFIFLVALLQPTIYCFGQNMLSYSDPQGNFYIYDGGKIVHLEHNFVRDVQTSANSITYINDQGILKYYTNHVLTSLDITNPLFFKNTDGYMYYRNGSTFSLFNGLKKEYLGYIDNLPYAYSDSIAAVHDFSNYFFIYTKNQFFELEKNAVKKIFAGDNLVSYVDQNNYFKVYYDGQKIELDAYPPIMVKTGANTIAYIDNYNYLKIFYANKIYEMYALPQLNCFINPNIWVLNAAQGDVFCAGDLVSTSHFNMPIFKVGDHIVAFLDESDRFKIFYEGVTFLADNLAPSQYHVVDNIVWFIDNNQFLKVFYEGTITTIETYTPSSIKANKDIVAYLDRDKKLKAFYKGDVYEISQSIVLDYALNQTLIMYSNLKNNYSFFSFE